MKIYIKIPIQCLCIVYLASIVGFGSPLTPRDEFGQDENISATNKTPVKIEEPFGRTPSNRSQRSLSINSISVKRNRKHSLKMSRFLRNPFIDFPKGYNVTGLERKLEAYKAKLPNPHMPFLIPEDVLQLPNLAEIDGHIVVAPKKYHLTRNLENGKRITSEKDSQNSGILIETSKHESVKNDHNKLKHPNQFKYIDTASKHLSEISDDKYYKSKAVNSNDYFDSDYVDNTNSDYTDENDDVYRDDRYDDGHGNARYGGDRKDAGYDDGSEDSGYDDDHEDDGRNDHEDDGHNDDHEDDGYNDHKDDGYDDHGDARYDDHGGAENDGHDDHVHDGPGNADYAGHLNDEDDGHPKFALESGHAHAGQDNGNLEAEMDDGHVDDEYYDYYDDTVEEAHPKNILPNVQKTMDLIVDKSEKDTTHDSLTKSFRRKRDLNNLSTTSEGLESNKTGRLIDIFTRANSTSECITPKNESGQCLSFTECPIGNIVNNYNLFLQYMCLRGLFVGICCPDNPVVEISDSDENSTESVKEDIKQPPEGCGLTHNTRIVGGTVSVPHQWNWMVALTRRNRFFCGGVIINDWYILTAAHCVLGVNVKDLKVRLGEYNFSEKNEHKHDIPVAEIKRHAMFLTLTFQHDVALLKLKRRIEYSKFIGSICLPEQTGRNYAEAKGTVVGWGTVSFGGAASPVLRQVTVPVWENEDCDRSYFLETIDDSFLCAGSPENGEDACQGDSGGPLMILNSEGRWEVIGIVSWGRRCGDPRYPGVYTRVTSYLDWIVTHAQ